MQAEIRLCGKEFVCPNCKQVVKKGEEIMVKQDYARVHGISHTIYIRWHKKDCQATTTK